MEFATIAEYLEKRWEEEEDTLYRIMSQRGIYRYFQDNGDRLIADITAKRKILIECENALDRTGREATMGRAMLDLLAEPYTDRADFPGRRRT
ncbi:DUF6221 family protein [Nonomuraea angiospora]|uniref:DUF6221 family protein n=1 Tax=Nonomuraea angiospora TaxID=46172 RepID=UPI0029AADCC2|nr:DUF6221 family protein [Nonomuraea angiospora]MDX3110146.1 DUF6221 family protein [Nonomuraea angiospora]